MRKACRLAVWTGSWVPAVGLTLALTASAAAQQVIKAQPVGGPGMPAGGMMGGPGMGKGGPLPAPPGSNTNRATQFSGIKLIESTEYRNVIDAARAAVLDALLYEKQGKADAANRAWNDAITAVKTGLDTKEDFYVQVRERQPNGQDTVRWASVKFEANNLLGTMPKQGLDVYEVRFGGKAKGL